MIINREFNFINSRLIKNPFFCFTKKRVFNFYHKILSLVTYSRLLPEPWVENPRFWKKENKNI